MMSIFELHELENHCIKDKIPLIGRKKAEWLLQHISQTKPGNILECGTGYGYSGCILGSAGGRLITIENNKKNAAIAEIQLKQHHINADVITGDAVQKIKELANNAFDLVFIDFAKKKYNLILEDCIKRTRKNGYIIADNISFSGCADYKDAVLQHPQLRTKIINIGDGLACSIVKK